MEDVTRRVNEGLGLAIGSWRVRSDGRSVSAGLRKGLCHCNIVRYSSPD